MKRLRTLVHGGAVLFALVAGTAPAAEFQDPLDTPPITYKEPWKKPLLSVDANESVLVAAGLRGLVLRSADAGKSWQQISMPVSSDLTSVFILDESNAWIVGHDGLVLHSDDGGNSWDRQLDGRLSEQPFKDFYQEENGFEPEASARYLDEMAMNFRQGPSLPWLDVHFENAEEGFVVGSFGMIAHTSDGGKSWQPWLHRIDNPMAMNLNALAKVGDDLLIAGERGTLFRLDREQQQFEKIETGYRGSFFGVTGNAEQIVAYGLRGSIWKSLDQGESWEKVEGGFHVGITDAVMTPDMQVFASASGRLRGTADGGASFMDLPAPPVPYTSLVLTGNALVAASLAGVLPIPLQVPAQTAPTQIEE